ncbi:MAG: KilA-N domain-containing protein [Crinalium sp.]
MNIITHSVNSVAIELRTTDGYLNGTAMCVAHSKDISDWLALQSVWELVTALANRLGINPKTGDFRFSARTKVSAFYPTLVIVKRGSPESGGGTWIHPKLAVHLAQWCSPEFALLVSDWVDEWLMNGLHQQPKEAQPQPLDLQNTLSLLNGLLDPLTSKGVDVALIQSAKISAIALQHPEYQRLLTAVKEELTLLTPGQLVLF